MKKIIQNTTLFIFALVFAVLLVEGMFYLLNKLTPPSRDIQTFESMPSGERLDFFQYHPVYGFAGVPNISKELNGKFVTHNSKGLRGPELEFKKPSGTKRAVFIGDSQTWGWGVSDDETISHYTEQLLNIKDESTKYEALNLGASGFGVDQTYIRLLIEGLRYEPDYVVYTFFADNDVWEASTIEAWGVEKPYIYEKESGQMCASNVPPRRSSGWPADNLASIVENQFNIKTQTISIAGIDIDLANTQTAIYFKNRSISTSLFNAWGVDSDPIAALEARLGCVESTPGLPLPSWDEKLEMATKLMVQMKKVVEENGGEFFVVTKPIEDDYRNNRQGYDYQFVLDKLAAQGVKVIDIHSEGKSKNLSGDQLYIEYAHLSPEGNLLAADSLAKEILSQTD